MYSHHIFPYGKAATILSRTRMTLTSLVTASAVYWPLEMAYLRTALDRVYAPVFRAVQGRGPSYSRALPGGIVAYVALWTGLYAFVLRDAHRRSVRDTSLLAAAYAFAVYGVYNATNLATFDRWTWRVSIADTAWGVCVLTLVSTVAAVATRRWHSK